MTDDGYFGETVAATYDDDADPTFAPEIVNPAVDFLADFAGDGRALEFGIGTGRIGLPLAARGVPVHGIELSKATIATVSNGGSYRDNLGKRPPSGTYTYRVCDSGALTCSNNATVSVP